MDFAYVSNSVIQGIVVEILAFVSVNQHLTSALCDIIHLFLFISCEAKQVASVAHVGLVAGLCILRVVAHHSGGVEAGESWQVFDSHVGRAFRSLYHLDGVAEVFLHAFEVVHLA